MSHSDAVNRVEYGERRANFVAVPPEVAKELLFISTFDTTDPDSNAFNLHGYQRPPTTKRFAEIARYYCKEENRHLITPLLVSVRLHEEEEIDLFLQLLSQGNIVGIKKAFGDSVAALDSGWLVLRAELAPLGAPK